MTNKIKFARWETSSRRRQLLRNSGSPVINLTYHSLVNLTETAAQKLEFHATQYNNTANNRNLEFSNCMSIPSVDSSFVQPARVCVHVF